MLMKPTLSILLSCLLEGIVSADESQNTSIKTKAPQEHPHGPQARLVQTDPRYPSGVVLRFSRGTKPAIYDQRAYVIIAWMHPREESKPRGYQFWGDDRILEQKTIELVLEAILKERPRDVFVVGNDWGAGSELDPLLQKLSNRHQIDVIGGSTFAFDQVDFRDEPVEVKSLITKVIDQALKAQLTTK